MTAFAFLACCTCIHSSTISLVYCQLHFPYLLRSRPIGVTITFTLDCNLLSNSDKKEEKHRKIVLNFLSFRFTLRRGDPLSILVLLLQQAPCRILKCKIYFMQNHGLFFLINSVHLNGHPRFEYI